MTAIIDYYTPKTELAMQIIEKILPIQPAGQVQLLNQGDIEVDFRLVHREGKFAPRHWGCVELCGARCPTFHCAGSSSPRIMALLQNLGTMEIDLHKSSAAGTLHVLALLT